MKIKNQLRISILAFGIILVIIVGSIIFTQQQTAQLEVQEILSHDIQTRASNLAYISNDYFQNKQTADLTAWENQYLGILSDLSQLKSTSVEETKLINNVKVDIQSTNSIFNESVAYIQSIPQNESGVVHPALKANANRMAVQTQALAFDAQQLSQIIRSQVDQASFANLILIVVVLGLFGAYFITNYLITYQKTLKSISELQAGVAIVGSGNLDHSVKANEKDEIGELGRSFNQMTSNLKRLTASKADLEKEISERKKAEKEIAGLAKFPMENPAVVLRLDEKGILMFANPSAQDFLQSWQTKIGEHVPEHIWQKVAEALASDIRAELEENLGDEVFSFLIAPVISERYANLYGRKITKRKKAEEDLKRRQAELETLFDNIPAGLVLFEAKSPYKVLAHNKYYQALFDEPFRSRGMVGLNINEYAPEVEASGIKAVFDEVVRTKKPKSILEFPYKSNPPNETWFNWYMAPVMIDDKPVALVSMSLDVTDRHMTNEALQAAQTKLQEYASSLEKLVEERTKQLKDSERLATIGATAGMVGHDIRNPLQAITSDVYLIKSDLDSTPECDEKESMNESLTGIEKNVENINKIVQDLQDYARPLAPNAKETDLEKVFDDVLIEKAIPQNIKLTRKVEPEARKLIADPDLLKRILTNLVNNAVQSMPEGGRLSVQAIQEANDLVITIKDTGVGIPEDIKPKLFTPLFTTKSKGQGFGLAVVKRLTEALNGTVTFESIEGNGTTFTVRLPSQKLKDKWTYK